MQKPDIPIRESPTFALINNTDNDIMSANRNKRAYTQNPHGMKAKNSPSSNGKNGSASIRTGANGHRLPTILKKVSHLPIMLILFVAVWAFLYFFYADMMAVAEQRGFFSTSGIAMQFYSSQPLGWLYVAGRFLLLTCKLPLLGTLLIALMLTASAWLFDQAFALKGWWHVLSLTLPFVYVFYLFYKGLNLVYLAELSWIMSIPLIALVVCAVMALIRRVATKHKIVAPWRQVRSCTGLQSVGLIGWVAVLFVVSVIVSETYAKNDRVTAAMLVSMYNEDWDKMIEQANDAPHPTRTVTGLRALALNQTGRLASELFNFRYQYPNAHLKRDAGQVDGGIDLIVIDCNFSAGLTRAAYHEAMEQSVLEGPSIYRLKRMAQCAIINKENNLARKYLGILKTVPFESKFVEKYEPMLEDYNLVAQTPWFSSALELEPVHDSFEQNYREPLFLGYNIALVEAKSMRGLYNSLFAALYSKDMQAFGERIPTMFENKVMLPQVCQEAFVVENIKNLAAIKQFNISPYVLQTMKNFLGECFTAEAKNLTPKEKAKRFPQYMGTYEYYYYFQNIPDENYSLSDDDNKKGGVN